MVNLDLLWQAVVLSFFHDILRSMKTESLEHRAQKQLKRIPSIDIAIVVSQMKYSYEIVF